jgi:hypothetical protein
MSGEGRWQVCATAGEQAEADRLCADLGAPPAADCIYMPCVRGGVRARLAVRGQVLLKQVRREGVVRTAGTPPSTRRADEKPTGAGGRVRRPGVVETFTSEEIFERDRYRCHICKRKCRRRAAVVPDPLAPTIDHLIPLAKGGEHTRANVATACFQCNSVKGDRGGGEQLALC